MERAVNCCDWIGTNAAEHNEQPVKFASAKNNNGLRSLYRLPLNRKQQIVDFSKKFDSDQTQRELSSIHFTD
ncbi:hypothetical protein [Leptospira santarosai]|uniref:hypothetical protein n=1 Tax=Leptospira santarosai TaxID=28183 RepID=UPI0005184193|nr:hypothetical protein [Leptospira santarosai]